MTKFKTFLGFMFVVLVFPVTSAMAAGPWSIFGEAGAVKKGAPPNPWAIELMSECPSGYPTCFADGSFTFGGVAFKQPNGKLVFSDINQLSTDYNVQASDCGGGSPRFSITIANTGGTVCNSPLAPSCNIFVYIGPSPSFTGCANGWQSTGNMIDDPDLRFDTSQLAGGTFYDSYANALTLAGDSPVLSISLVVDGGWFPPATSPGQDILVDNVTVNNFQLNAKGFSKK
jgi:hypothetical protein